MKILPALGLALLIGAASPVHAAPDSLPFPVPPLREELQYGTPRYVGILQATCIYWVMGYVPIGVARKMAGSFSENLPRRETLGWE